MIKHIEILFRTSKISYLSRSVFRFEIYIYNCRTYTHTHTHTHTDTIICYTLYHDKNCPKIGSCLVSESESK